MPADNAFSHWQKCNMSGDVLVTAANPLDGKKTYVKPEVKRMLNKFSTYVAQVYRDMADISDYSIQQNAYYFIEHPATEDFQRNREKS